MSRYRQTMTEALQKVYEQDKDHEISMARGELEAIADKATQLAGALQGKSDEGNPLEAWVQSKITKAKDYINSVSDYMMYNPDMKESSDGYIVKFANSKGAKIASAWYKDEESAKKALEAIRKNGGNGIISKGKMNEELEEATYGWTLVSKAKDLAKKFANNMTKAVAEIEKLEKGLSKNPTVKQELLKYNESLEEKFTVQITKKDGTTMELGRYNTAAEAQRFVDMYGKGAKVKKESINEEVDLDEGKIKDIFTANKEGESIDNIAKRLKMSANDVKKILGEETLDEKVADSIIKDLQKAYAPLKGKTISPEMANKMSKHLDGQSFDVVTLRQLMKAQIPFISTLARNKIYKKTGKFEEITEATPGMKDNPSDKAISDKDTAKEKELKIKLDKEKDTDALEKQLIAAQGQINTLRTKLENEKNRAIKPEPNPETGEVPLTVGVAHKYIKDKKEKEMKKEQVDNYPTSDIAKHKKDVATDPKMGEKKPVHLGAKMTYESIQGLKNKADKTGMPYSILKKVYDRGMAAWRGGHRPGASQQQWAFARVNSFVTKSSGTWGGADKDLAAKVKGSKK